VDDLCALDGSGSPILHIIRDKFIGAALKIKIKLARRRFRRGTGEGRVFHSKPPEKVQNAKCKVKEAFRFAKSFYNKPILL
jgi:hypothetical protein